ncbi:MAG: hypothetical protein KKH98_11770, partial [Spirochaetes bacterium]|nr:hypothetical protein [Spirochaetota bacterium]
LYPEKKEKSFFLKVENNYLIKKDLITDKVQFDRHYSDTIDTVIYNSNYIIVSLINKEGYCYYDVLDLHNGKHLWKKTLSTKVVKKITLSERYLYLILSADKYSDHEERSLLKIYDLKDDKNIITLEDPYIQNDQFINEEQDDIFIYEYKKINGKTGFKIALIDLTYKHKQWEKEFRTDSFRYYRIGEYFILVLFDRAENIYSILKLDKQSGETVWTRELQFMDKDNVAYRHFNNYIIFKYRAGKEGIITDFSLLDIGSGEEVKRKINMKEEYSFSYLNADPDEFLLLDAPYHYFLDDVVKDVGLLYFNFSDGKQWKVDFPPGIKLLQFFTNKNKMYVIADDENIYPIDKTSGKLIKKLEYRLENISDEYIYKPVSFMIPDDYIGTRLGCLAPKYFHKASAILVMAKAFYLPPGNFDVSANILEVNSKYSKVGLMGAEYETGKADNEDFSTKFSMLYFDFCKIKLGYKFIFAGFTFKTFWMYPEFNFKNDPIGTLPADTSVSEQDKEKTGLGFYLNLSLYLKRLYLEVGASFVEVKSIPLNILLDFIVSEKISLKFIYNNIIDRPFISEEDGKQSLGNILPDHFAYEVDWKKVKLGFSYSLLPRNRYNVMIESMFSYNRLDFTFREVEFSNDKYDITDTVLGMRSLEFFTVSAGLAFYY